MDLAGVLGKYAAAPMAQPIADVSAAGKAALPTASAAFPFVNGMPTTTGNNSILGGGRVLPRIDVKITGRSANTPMRQLDKGLQAVGKLRNTVNNMIVPGSGMIAPESPGYRLYENISMDDPYYRPGVRR